MEKPVNIIGIDCARHRVPPPDHPPQPKAAASFARSKYTEISAVAMFLRGHHSVWKVAKFHRLKPTVVEQMIREELIRRGLGIVRRVA